MPPSPTAAGNTDGGTRKAGGHLPGFLFPGWRLRGGLTPGVEIGKGDLERNPRTLREDREASCLMEVLVIWTKDEKAGLHGRTPDLPSWDLALPGGGGVKVDDGQRKLV